MNDSFDRPSDQLVLSFELLQLMEWLVEHESEALKKIIKRALSKGLAKKLQKQNPETYNMELLQGNIIDFLETLELLLLDSNEELAVNDIIQKNMMPALAHIDRSSCHDATVQSSAAVASSKKERNPSENIEQVFFEELLRQWKPKDQLSEN